MGLIDFMKLLITEYWALWIPFTIGIGVLIEAERKVAHEKGDWRWL